MLRRAGSHQHRCHTLLLKDPAECHLRQCLSTLLGLGVIALDRGDTRHAEDYFNEIKRINPNSGLYHEGMGLLNKRNGNHARAAELFTQVIKVQPSAQLLGHRADCYLAMKRLNDAEADIRTALEMTPDDPYLYLLRAKLNKLRFQRDDMERDIDTAVSLGLSRDYINMQLGNED